MSVNESYELRNIQGSQKGASLNQGEQMSSSNESFWKVKILEFRPVKPPCVTVCVLFIAFPAIQWKSTQFICRQWVLHLVCAQCCLHAVISDVLSVPIQTLFLTAQLVTSFSHSLGMGYRQSHEALHLSSRRSGGRGRCHEEACRLNKLLLSLQSWVSSLHILLTHAKWETVAITTWLL